MGLTLSRSRRMSGRDCRVRVTGRSFFRGAVRGGHPAMAVSTKARHLDSADVVSFHRRRGRRRAARTGLCRTRRRAGTLRRPTGSRRDESGNVCWAATNRFRPGRRFLRHRPMLA
jgi:hypothetical protein